MAAGCVPWPAKMSDAPDRAPGRPSGELSLVSVGPAHAALLAALHGMAFAGSGERPWTQAEVEGLLNLPTVAGWLAVGGDPQGGGPGSDDPLGLLLVQVAVDEAEVLTVGVRPDSRRRGIGRFLMLEGMNRLFRLGCDRLMLEVAETNTSARILYEALGFQMVGRRRQYYRREGGKIDALVFQRLLKT